MKTPVLLFLSTVLFFSCQKSEDSKDSFLENGLYIGSFHRTGMDTVEVAINFMENRFENASGQDKYPAICKGSYRISGEVINFSDSCTWTADFDWTLILNGTYTIRQDSDQEVRIFRTTAGLSDEYRLRRLVR